MYVYPSIDFMLGDLDKVLGKEIKCIQVVHFSAQ
jgi:hypothetical protein